MDIKLHLGVHRTGTSSFQANLWANRAALAQRGVTCWTPRRTRDGLMRGMMRHPALISVEDERRALRSTGRIRLEVDRLARLGQTTLVISEENIIGTMRNNLADARLYPLLGERLRRFAPAFEGYPIQIGLCVRSYESYWASVLSQWVVRGGAMPSEDLLDFLTTQPRRWRTMVRDIADALPDAEITVWSFERLGGRSDLVLDLLKPGSSEGLHFDRTRRNRSANVGQINAVLAMRGEPAIDAGPQGEDRYWTAFNEDQCSILRSEYRRDIAWLKAGAEGLATYIDGRNTPAVGPDRATSQTHADAGLLAPDRGQTHGIEKRLGGARAG